MEIILYTRKNLILFLSILFSTILAENPIIVIPFKINRIPNTKASDFNSTSFIKEYYYRDFYTSLPTGVPSKKILTLLDTHSHMFLFGENYLKKTSLNEIFDPEKIISKETYDRKKSLSFKNISKFNYEHAELKKATLCSEIFLLYNDILMENQLSIGDLEFIIDDDVQDNLHIRLGLGRILTVDYGGPPHFIQSLLNVGVIKDQSWTFKFTSKNDGLFILGDEPHKYEDVSLDKRYQRKNYFSTFSASSVELHNPISITAQDVFVYDKNEEEIEINTDKNCYLNYNNGFITSTREYWDYIKKNFFNELFVANICKEELIRFNTDEDTFRSYYLISCDKIRLMQEYKNKLDTFPTIYFFIFDFNYNFEITKDDVFTEVNNVLYFMIIFQKEIFNNPDLVFWDLGLPFLLKYQFVHNYEKKTVGFYIPEKEEEEPEEEEEEIEPSDTTDQKPQEKEKEKEKEKKGGNNDNNYIVIIIFGIIVGIGLLIGAFCLGKYMFQQRKKKANELDENFDYMESNDKNKENQGIIN